MIIPITNHFNLVPSGSTTNTLSSGGPVVTKCGRLEILQFYLRHLNFSDMKFVGKCVVQDSSYWWLWHYPSNKLDIKPDKVKPLSSTHSCVSNLSFCSYFQVKLLGADGALNIITCSGSVRQTAVSANASAVEMKQEEKRLGVARRRWQTKRWLEKVQKKKVGFGMNGGRLRSLCRCVFLLSPDIRVPFWALNLSLTSVSGVSRYKPSVSHKEIKDGSLQRNTPALFA